MVGEYPTTALSWPWCSGGGKSHGRMGMPMTVAMGNAYYVFFMPMVIAMGMRMPTVMGMPMIVCTGTYTIGKHASWCLNRGHLNELH